MSRLRLISNKKLVLMGLPLALLLVLAISAYWLLHSASGAAWLWNRLEAAVVGPLRSSQVEGDLGSGFVIGDLVYRSDTLDLSIRRVEIQAGPGWWPPSIQVQALALRDVEIVTRSSAEQPGDMNRKPDIRAALAELDLPVPLRVHDAVLTNVRLQENDEPSVILLETLRFQAELDERLTVDQLDIIAPGVEAGLQGYLALGPPFELSASVKGRIEINGQAGAAGLIFPFKLESSGNLDKLQFSIASDESGLQLDGEILQPETEAGWNIKGILNQLQWPVDGAEEYISLSGVTLASQGEVSDWSFEMSSAVGFGALKDAGFAISGYGSANGIQINSAVLTGPGVDLGFSGKLDWSPNVEAELSAVFRQMDWSPWLAGWPAGKYMAGNLDLNWSETRLEIPMSKLTVTGTDLMLDIEADIDIEANSVNARLGWSKLSWPLADATPDFSSPSGSLNVSGNVDQWLADGQVQVQLGAYPQGRFGIQGGGDRTSARLAILNGEVLGGSVSGEASADWADGLAWDAAIQARAVNPAQLLPAWPGRLDASFEVDAQSQQEQIQINLVSLQGLLRGVPLSASGGLNITGDRLAFSGVQVRTDEALLELDGAMTEAAGASVKFSGHLPSMLLRGASGRLELAGRYSSHANDPLLDLQLQASDLSWNGFSIKGLTASTPETGATGVVPALQLDASGLVWEDVELDEFSLSLSPAGEQYRLMASLVSDKVNLSTTMTLAPENSDDVFGGNWRGLLEGLEVAINQTYAFELLEPASVEWSSGSVLLAPVCLHENSNANFCISGDYQGNGDWSLVADVTAIPLDYVRDILALDVHFEQLIEGRLEWHQPRGQAPTGGAEFRITPGGIIDLLDNDLLAQTSEGRFGFALKNGNLESGVLDIELPGVGFIDVDFNVLDIIVDGAQKVQGRAITRLEGIRQIGELMLPGLDAVDGRFESNIQLGGTLSDPDFDGGFRFSDGLIQYAPVGLDLEDIEFEGQVKKRDRGSFKGQFRAGEGIGSIDGRFLFEDIENMQMEIALSGDQLLLVNTDTLSILTETDLRIGLATHRMDINGHIRVPRARLTPSNLLLGEVNDSEDLVITSHGSGQGSVADKTADENRVYGQLEVSFGDDVFIKVPGVETNLSGSTLFTWSGDPVPLAQGSYQLQGRVDVYGPSLSINNGTISFPGVPADNPILNIRAGRDIYGNTQIRSAGVQVIGTLKRPVLEAYTVPVTNEDRAWTLLITGTDFDQGQGVGGFNVGTYIAPKLYVSYGISLFEDENVASARYDLKKGFGIKVTSGQRETGLDVSYTIDR